MANTNYYTGNPIYRVDSTPYGYWANDPDFQNDCEKAVVWATMKLGYPIVDIELTDNQMFTAFEEAIIEFSRIINTFNIKDNFLYLKGHKITTDYTYKQVKPNLHHVVQLSEQYGLVTNNTKNTKEYRGYIQTSPSVQRYDLTDSSVFVVDSNHTGSMNNLTITNIYHKRRPAIRRSGVIDSLSNEFGWREEPRYLLTPLHDEVMRAMQIEMSEKLRKSTYSFKLRNGQIDIYPRPSSEFKIWVDYVVNDEQFSNTYDDENVATDPRIKDMSNAQYNVLEYALINSSGKHWIKRYALALIKEMLGRVRSKYDSIPIPNADVSLDGDTLLSESSDEKENLVTELKEDLEETTTDRALEKELERAQKLNEIHQFAPLKIYVK